MVFIFEQAKVYGKKKVEKEWTEKQKMISTQREFGVCWHKRGQSIVSKEK